MKWKSMGAKQRINDWESSRHQRTEINTAERRQTFAIIKGATFKKEANVGNGMNRYIIDYLTKIITLKCVKQAGEKDCKATGQKNNSNLPVFKSV